MKQSGDRLDLSIRAECGRSYLPYLRRMIPRAWAIIGAPTRELSLALVGDTTMSGLHVEFMGIEGTTDVLTFELERDGPRVSGGEVVICVDEARRQARARKLKPERELLLYAVHGMLHLAGYDDRTATAYQEMHRREDQVLRRLGVGTTFAKT